MPATVTQLGARALRKIGVVIVPTASQPAPGGPVSLADMGARVLRNLGVSFIATADRLTAGPTLGAADIAANVLRDFDIVTTEAERPSFNGNVVSVTELGARSLRAAGVSFIATGSRLSTGTPYAQADIAAMVLRDLGIVTTEAERPSFGTTISVTELGARALRAVGVSFIATGSRLTAGATYAQADVAAMVMRDLGILTTEAERPSLSATVGQAEIAARALRAVGVNPFGPAAAPSTETTYTLDQIATFALQHLGVISETETETTQSHALILSKVNAVHETITRLDIAAWLGTAVPARALPYYITMASALGAASFGPRAEAATYAGAYEVAERKLLQIALSGVDGQNLAAFKVAAVHDMLTAQGFVYWTLTTIPQAFAEDYVVLAAEMLSVVMGHVSDKRASVTTVGVGVDAQNRGADMKASQAAIDRIRQAGIVRNAYARVLDEVSQIHEQVSAIGLATWPISTIPAAIGDAYRDLAVQNLAMSFGKAADDAARKLAWEQVRRLALSSSAGQTLAEQRVSTAHDALVAQGLVYWAVGAIPQAFADDYVALAASMLAPVVSGQFSDQAAQKTMWDVAVGHIRQAGIVRNATTRALDEVSQIHEQVSATGLATWPITAVPPAIADAYRDIAVQNLGVSFGLPPRDPVAAKVAWEQLRRLAMSSPAGQTLAEQEVSVAHDGFVAQGLVYWTLTTIPQAFADDYVAVSAVSLGAVISGQSIDPAVRQSAWDGAAGRIKQHGIVRNAYERAVSEIGQVHEEINATGLAQWPLTAIPAAVADAYQDLVTQNMGLSFGRSPVDDASNQSAWTRLRRLALSTPEGQSLAQQKVAAAHEVVAAQSLAFWSVSAVPLSVAEDLVAMATVLMAPVITGQPNDPTATQPAWDAAKEHIRKVCMIQGAQSLAEEKVRAVHADLDVRGMIRWTLLDLPDYAEEPYVAIAASLLAPEFGIEVDPNMRAGAKKALARAVAVPAGREPVKMDAF